MHDLPISENETSDEAYDKKHGTPGPTGKPPVSEDQEWGESLNPVRETPTPFKNTGSVGK